MNKVYISFDEIESMVEKIANKVKSLDLENVYGQPRGGLVPAVMLSHKLGIPLILDINKVSDNTLFVEEIIDTGKTLLGLKEKIGNCTVVCLTKRYTSKFEPYYYVKFIDNDDWLVFPWEINE